MKDKKVLVRLALSLAISSLTSMAFGQAAPAGTQQLQLSAFGGLTGTYIGFEGGKNLAITAGADVTYLGFRRFLPAFELRGTYPIDDGHISSEKNFLLGPKVTYPIGRLHPYADLLVGRGTLDYLNGGIIVITPNSALLYLSTNTFIFSPGVGLDYSLTHNIEAKVDGQFQHWNTPVTSSGSIYSKALTVGFVYNFDFNPRHRHGHN